MTFFILLLTTLYYIAIDEYKYFYSINNDKD